MKSMIIALAIILIAMVVAIGYIIYETAIAVEQVQRAARQTKEMVGEKIVIGKDTLTLVDYSVIRQTFTLSNGREVGVGFVERVRDTADVVIYPREKRR